MEIEFEREQEVFKLNDCAEQIKGYKELFSTHAKGMNDTVKIGENFDTLKRAINNTFEKNINTYLLLLGNKGFGKEKAMSWAVENSDYANEILYIPIESVVFNKEKKL